MKKVFIIIIILLILTIGISVYFRGTPFTNSCWPSVCKTLVEENKITLAGNVILTIDQFPDEIEVAKGIVFGSSDRISEAKISPDGKWLAIAVSGAAHDFGWVYNIETKNLAPVIFSYGGGVVVKNWKSNAEVVFSVTTPKPDTYEKTININNLPEFPL